jgi:hypothetical protein
VAGNRESRRAVRGTIVGTVTTTARHSSVPCAVVTRISRSLQSIASAGQQRDIGPSAALATTAPSPPGTAQLTSVSSYCA